MPLRARVVPLRPDTGLRRRRRDGGWPMSRSLVNSASGDAHDRADHQQCAVQHPQDVALTTLLSRTADGNIVAFAALYDQTCARVHGVALRVLRDHGFAEETTQEVYLQVWRAARCFDPTKGSPLAWLTTLAHRRAVDRVRSEQAHTQRATLHNTDHRIGAFDPVSDAVLGRIERRAVGEGLASLTDRQREAITLAYYRGLTYREAADHLGVSVSTIKTRIRDGLIRLKKYLDAAGPAMDVSLSSSMARETPP